MRVRITQKIAYQDGFLFPGSVVDVAEKVAQNWIDEDQAIPFADEPQAAPPKVKAKKQKEVRDGDG